MNQTLKNPVTKLLVWLILLVWSVAVLYPLLWTFLGSLKDNKQFFLNSPWSLPNFPFLWSNFSYVWTKYHLGTYFTNSIVIAGGSTILGLILAATTAYILARYPFKGSKLLFMTYIASLAVPLQLAIIPLFFLMQDFHMINKPIGLILVYTAQTLPFGIFLLVGFYKSLPKELEEASVIDGASYFGTFFRIMLPLSQPGLIAVAITNILANWNEYFFGSILINDSAQYTVPVGVAIMQAEFQYRTEWGPLFAALMITTIPTLIFYMIFQRQIASGITAGSVK